MIHPENSKPRLRAAVIGGGFIGPVHVEALRRIGVEVVGVLGSSSQRIAPLAQALGIADIYENLDELANDTRVDVVHVTSPNDAHFDQVQRLLQAGKHVVCEKPLATSSAQTSALVQLAQSKPSLAAAVNYNVRYYPLCHEMRERVANGDIGRVFSVNGSYAQDWLLYREDFNWRVEADGGTNLRAVADIGTHWMDLAQFVVCQPIRSLVADLAIFHKQRLRAVGPSQTFNGESQAGDRLTYDVATEDFGSVLFRMPDDIRGLFHVSQVAAGHKNRLSLEVCGSQGSLSWNSENPEQLFVGRRNAPNVLIQRDPALLSTAARAISSYPGGHAEGFPDTFKQLFATVYSWIGRDDANALPKFPSFADGHREIVLCEAIARSAREQSWVEVAGNASNETPVDADLSTPSS